MRHFDVQSVEIPAPFDETFTYISDPNRLPDWTHAFRSVAGGRAVLATPRGAVDVRLDVSACRERGTIDWSMTFPDGSVGRAYSRLVDAGGDRPIYSFLLLAPPAPLEHIEGALEAQARVLADELSVLQRKLSRRA